MVVKKICLKDFYPFLGENDRNPYVDMYLPYNLAEMKRQEQKRPSMVVCPGGGYWMCSEREAEPIALKFLEMGFNVFVIYYSTAKSGPHRYPTQLIEVAALFDYINKNAEELHVDTEKIGIIGFSAGGHLAAHYSNLWNDEIIKEKFGATYKPAASILCYAVISVEDHPNRGSFENLIGHFGLGFYSAFMVADKVEIVTKSYSDAPAMRWVCDGSPNFTMEEDSRRERGTDTTTSRVRRFTLDSDTSTRPPGHSALAAPQPVMLRTGWRDASVIVAGKQRLVGVRVEKFVQVGRVVGLDAHQPAPAEGVLVDQFGLVGEVVVDGRHQPRHGTIHLVGGIGGLQGGDFVLGAHHLPHVGKDFDEIQLRHLLLRIVGQPDCHVSVVLFADPAVSPRVKHLGHENSFSLNCLAPSTSP